LVPSLPAIKLRPAAHELAAIVRHESVGINISTIPPFKKSVLPIVQLPVVVVPLHVCALLFVLTIAATAAAKRIFVFIVFYFVNELFRRRKMQPQKRLKKSFYLDISNFLTEGDQASFSSMKQ
jgi:hypothetical protein